jgi:hypothetical protein
MLRLSGSQSKATWTGLAYSLLSPTAFFIPWVRTEIGSPLRPWRICTLVLYGDGPHITALALLPLALVALDTLLQKPRLASFFWAVASLGAVALTNWIGSFAMGATALLYLIATTHRVSDVRRLWIAAGAAVTAYLLVCPWVPPSTIRLIPANSAMILEDARVVAAAMPTRLTVALLIVFGIKLVCEWRKVSATIQFALLWFLVFGGIPVTAEWLKFQFILQPHRYQLELDLTFCFLIVLLIHEILPWLPKRARAAFFVTATLCALIQIRSWKPFMTALIQPARIEDTIEFRTAVWLRSHIGNGRVFATGSISFWLNAFSDVPQLGGGADQGLPSEQLRTAIRTIYGHSDYAPDPDGSLALLWMRAYGVDMAVVGGSQSAEYFKLFRGVSKFDRVATRLWHEGDDSIYSIPRRSRSLAQIVPISAIVTGQSLDVGSYVAALENSSNEVATFIWKNRHTALIDATLAGRKVVSVQISYDPGWRATVNGRVCRLYRDGLGLIVIDPNCSGKCAINLAYGLSTEALFLRITAMSSALILFASCLIAKAHRLRQHRSRTV